MAGIRAGGVGSGMGLYPGASLSRPPRGAAGAPLDDFRRSRKPPLAGPCGVAGLKSLEIPKSVAELLFILVNPRGSPAKVFLLVLARGTSALPWLEHWVAFIGSTGAKNLGCGAVLKISPNGGVGELGYPQFI